MSRDILGTFELMVLFALVRLGDEACGVRISRTIEESRGRTVVNTTVYGALRRLEEKNFVSSRVGEPTAVRGGRAKRYFRITAKGIRQVNETKRALVNLWRGVPVGNEWAS